MPSPRAPGLAPGLVLPAGCPGSHNLRRGGDSELLVGDSLMQRSLGRKVHAPNNLSGGLKVMAKEF